MNKLQKFLSKLDFKERKIAKGIIEKVTTQDFSGLSVKKLKGVENLFRVRKGDIRLIYSQKDKIVIILEIGRRNDTTYNF